MKPERNYRQKELVIYSQELTALTGGTPHQRVIHLVGRLAEHSLSPVVYSHASSEEELSSFMKCLRELNQTNTRES